MISLAKINEIARRHHINSTGLQNGPSEEFPGVAVIEVCDCIRWLRTFATPRRTINRRYSSYFLKHIVEKNSTLRYVTNGALLVAALTCGFRLKRIGNGPNAYLAADFKKEAFQKRVIV